MFFFFFQAEDGIRDDLVTGVQTCALPISLRRFGLGEDLPTLAVVGGSQGAESLNRGVVEALNGTASKLQIIHVTGKAQVDLVRAAYAAKGARAVVLDFVADMDSLYS